MTKISLSKPNISKKEINIINKSLKSGWLTHGPNNRIFEKNFSKLIKSKYSISMNSCTSALECALKVIEKKGEVIIPSWTWVSTANAVINTGNVPVFADVDTNSRNITAEYIKKKITKKTIAVIVVHYGGLPCQMKKILSLTKKHKLQLIEDSAETLGASCDKKLTGSFGNGCFSFFPTKNITTTEGGMFTTSNKAIFEKVKLIIAHGINKKLKKHFWHRQSSLAGHNFRLPNHLAALGVSQLKRLHRFNKKRRLIAKKYDKFLKSFSNIFEVQTINKNLSHSYQMYTCLVKKSEYRNKLLYYLKSKNIEASAHFDPPLHRQNYLKKYSNERLENTDNLSQKIISLPMYPDLKDREIQIIKKTIKQWCKKYVI
ncbi:DegT/DnrJ/EryC1/StrS aminotransferase family protein [Pelagibacterales bacterium SAG-MED39]|nr:DegT/DnrJ/EryC1/StrS aminotransferase family protein [Pelagibacterales bacterium SAG-MED39]